MTESLISPSSSLEDYFRGRVEDVVERHHIDGDEDTRWYIVRLLCDYSRNHRFHDSEHAESSLVPLATYYRQPSRRRTMPNASRTCAASATSRCSSPACSRARSPAARSTFDYYVSMGCSAYASLAESTYTNRRMRAFAGVFSELAEHFEAYVSALSEIPERGRDRVGGAPEETLLALVAEWEATRHPGLARRLRERGVFIDESDAPLH